jgi:hypothetical protein
MKRLTLIFMILLACATAYSQRPGPNEQNLLIMQEGPPLNYTAVPNGLTFPDGVMMGLPGDLEFDSKGHLWVVSRPGMDQYAEPLSSSMRTGSICAPSARASSGIALMASISILRTTSGSRTAAVTPS